MVLTCNILYIVYIQLAAYRGGYIYIYFFFLCWRTNVPTITLCILRAFCAGLHDVDAVVVLCSSCGLLVLSLLFWVVCCCRCCCGWSVVVGAGVATYIYILLSAFNIVDLHCRRHCYLSYRHIAIQLSCTLSSVLCYKTEVYQGISCQMLCVCVLSSLSFVVESSNNGVCSLACLFVLCVCFLFRLGRTCRADAWALETTSWSGAQASA